MQKQNNNIVDVVVEDTSWGGIGLEDLSVKAFECVIQKVMLKSGPYEISILACNDARIAELNSEFRQKNKATNVLSWPSYELSANSDGGSPEVPPTSDFGEPFVNIGDIAIAYETCANEAKQAGISTGNHVTHLITHGILHLLGYDHETDADADLMEKLEIELLASMGIGNPYENV